MRIQQSPMFRRAFIPWYDSDHACFISIFFLLIAIIFSITGVLEAHATPEYRQYMWIPLTVFVLSIVVGISVVYRLYRRITGTGAKDSL